MATVRIALVQQPASADHEENLTRGLEAMGRARERGADLVAFAELAFQPFFPRARGDDPDAPEARAEPVPGPTTERIAGRARELGQVVVCNLYERDDDGRRFDASPVIDADGSLLGVARMVHIADFEGFHERDWYAPGDRGAPVFDTAVGRVGVAICYDRHFPEYTRALGVAGAELVVVPQAGVTGEWAEGMYEAELRVAAFQNGYFAALCNRVGREGALDFAGESYACDPEGRVLVRGAVGEEDLVIADLDLSQCAASTARRLFWRDRRPELYGSWLDTAVPVAES